MRIISSHTNPCFDKCKQWIMYIMYRARSWMNHMINRNCPGILPKCVSGGVSPQTRHSITETAHSIAAVCLTHAAIDKLFIVTAGAFWLTALNIGSDEKWWKSEHGNDITLQLWVVFFCPACSVLEIWNFKLTRSVNFIDELGHIFLSFVWSDAFHIIIFFASGSNWYSYSLLY